MVAEGPDMDVRARDTEAIGVVPRLVVSGCKRGGRSRERVRVFAPRTVVILAPKEAPNPRSVEECISGPRDADTEQTTAFLPHYLQERRHPPGSPSSRAHPFAS